MIIQADEDVIYELVKRAVDDAVNEKFTEFKLNFIPYSDSEEDKVIDSIFDNPAKYENQEFFKFDL